jgi:hypothetical protein
MPPLEATQLPNMIYATWGPAMTITELSTGKATTRTAHILLDASFDLLEADFPYEYATDISISSLPIIPK